MGYGILHTHTAYSLHDSAMSPEELVLRAKECGAGSVALTDHGTMLGLDEFMEAGKKHQVIAVPGIEIYLENKEHLLLVAVDYSGYQQIALALKEANKHQQKKGRITFPCLPYTDLEGIFKGSSHVIATTGCIAGPLGCILLERRRTELSNEKSAAKVQELKGNYDNWAVANSKYMDLVSEEKQLKEDKKGYALYLKKRFLTEAEKDDKKKALYMSALSMTDRIDKRLAQIRRERNAAKKDADKLKAKAGRYIKLKDALDQSVLPDPDELYLRAKELALKLKSIFPNFYIEIQYHGLEEERITMPLLCRIASETGTPLIAGQDAHMARKGDEGARQILRYNYFSKHQPVSECDKELYVKTEEELTETLASVVGEVYVAEAVKNTAVLSRCEVIMPGGVHHPKAGEFPAFQELIKAGVNRLKEEGIWDSQYEERLSHEIQVIKQMGYIDYHLIVWDYCRMIRTLSVVPEKMLPFMPRDFSKIEGWIDKHGFRSGKVRSPGRGSAAGSLVCYLLQITSVDPIKYNLLFDRYLNPERISMPDIDTDVKRCLRPYLIRYLKWKYGEDAVCSIMTKTTYGARNAVLMAGRDRASELYGDRKGHDDLEKEYLHKHTLKLTEMMDDGAGHTLEDYSDKVSKLYGSDQEKMIIWSRAKMIEGKLSGIGIHAGGIVIADNGDVGSYVPLAWMEEKKVWAAQCDMVQLEKKGLLKMDLLGLKTQDCISETLQLIEQHCGLNIDFDGIKPEHAVFENIFWPGRTNSVFQFESDGMKDMLKRFRPDSIEDLILLVAMYRPGPMQYLENVISVKAGKKKPEYADERLKEILAPTYGAIVYQEQVMQIFQVLAGYSLGQADLVRRAMSKKKSEKLAHECDAFVKGDNERGIPGCISNGIPEKIARRIFVEMTEFAKYAFNKSHAAAYALVAYQTAWLKYHYPLEFYCAMMNTEDDSLTPVFEDCHYDGIRLLPPCVNHSYYEFTIENGGIRYGFKGIKGIGDRKLPDLITDRRSSKRSEIHYQSLADFFLRTSDKTKPSLLNKRILEALAYSGALDNLTPDRKQVMELYNEMSQINADTWKPFTVAVSHICGKAGRNKDTVWNMEMETVLLGAVVSEDPLAGYQTDSMYGCTPYRELTDGRCQVMGYAGSSDNAISKTGMHYQKLKLMGKQGQLNVLYFGDAELKELTGKVVRVIGKISGQSFIAETVEYLPPSVSPYYLKLDSTEKTRKASMIMKNRETGSIPLVVEFHYNKEMKRIPVYVSEFYVTWDTIKSLKAKPFSACGISYL